MALGDSTAGGCAQAGLKLRGVAPVMWWSASDLWAQIAPLSTRELCDSLELAWALPAQHPAGGPVSGSETPGLPWLSRVQSPRVPESYRWANCLTGTCVCKAGGQLLTPKSQVGQGSLQEVVCLGLGRESFHFLPRAQEEEL